jgi:hypothetical protein
MDDLKGFGLTSQIYDASSGPIDWDELFVKLGTKCRVCKAGAVYTYYREENLPVRFGDRVCYLQNYALDYAVCELHKKWVRP